VCLVPTGLLTFDGKLLPNAHAFADLNGDNDTELIVGSMAGKIAGLSSSESAYEHSIDGCITTIVPHVMEGGAYSVLFVTTEEGLCFVLRKHPKEDRFLTLTQFEIPLNVSAAAIISTNLTLGTRDATIHMFDISNVENAQEIKKLRLHSEVESIMRQDTLLIICLNNGDVLKLANLNTKAWLQKGWQNSGRSFALSEIKSEGKKSFDALGCLDGFVQLKDMHTNDALWEIQLPDALLGMATISLFQDGDEEIALCCWNGDIYIVSKFGSQLRFTIPFSITAFFSGEFGDCAEDTLFCATTSGGILYYSGIGKFIRRIRHQSVLQAINTSDLMETLNSTEKRSMLLNALKDYLPSNTQSSEPSMTDCIRACVYAPNTIVEPKPIENPQLEPVANP
ncbi:hypothetical protein THRCLA_09148, partial [Thraustotheca clavata]